MLLGVIADDLTGASDIAGFIAAEGLSVVQYSGIPRPEDAAVAADVAVISLKSRSTPAEAAVRDSLAALRWLQARGCQRFYFKYCSTFDSTPKGNIGPVTDALMSALLVPFTVLCPSLPANGRTVRDGNLLVNGVPLADTGMRRHPLNPMTDSNIPRLMEAQARGRAGLLGWQTLAKGEGEVRRELERLRRDGVAYAVLDSGTEAELDVYAGALRDAVFLTGGSSLAAALAGRLRRDGLVKDLGQAQWHFPRGKTIILSGSCSEMTNRQTACYRKLAPEFRVEADKCLPDAAAYASQAAAWARAISPDSPAPMVNATVGPEELGRIQARHGGTRAAAAVEGFFAKLAPLLAGSGFSSFIVAGGETSGAVAAALEVRAFQIGPQIAPGVSWVLAAEQGLALAMKSGNFGDEAFFQKAQALRPGEKAP